MTKYKWSNLTIVYQTISKSKRSCTKYIMHVADGVVDGGIFGIFNSGPMSFFRFWNCSYNVNIFFSFCYIFLSYSYQIIFINIHNKKFNFFFLISLEEILFMMLVGKDKHGCLMLIFKMWIFNVCFKLT